MTCVCSVGLDMIAIPEETPASTIAAMIADEAAIGVINQKRQQYGLFQWAKKANKLNLVDFSV